MIKKSRLHTLAVEDDIIATRHLSMTTEQQRLMDGDTYSDSSYR